MNKLLFFAYYFPPIHSVACSRSFHIARYLAGKHAEHTIYTTSNQSLFPVDASYDLTALHIEHLPTSDYRTFASRRQDARLHHSEVKKRNLLVRVLLAINDAMPFSLLFGEGGLRYLLHGFRRGCSVLAGGDGLVFTSYRTASDVTIGFLLKRKFPGICWMVDFQDLPVNVNRLKVIPDAVQWFFWRFLLQKADQVSTVSLGLAEKLEKVYPKVKVMRDGINPRPYHAAHSDKFILSYTGSLYMGLQTATLLFQALARLATENADFAAHLQLSYAGKDSALWQQWMEQHHLTDFFVDHGMVSRTDAMHLQDQASINLLLTWSFPESKGIVTGKIYEYIAASKPILLLINGETDTEMEAWFAELACGKVCYNNDNQLQQIESFILEIFAVWKETKLSKPFIAPEIVRAMSWEHQLEKLWSE